MIVLTDAVERKNTCKSWCLFLIIFISAAFLFSSCKTQKVGGQKYDSKEVEKLSHKLGVEISSRNKGDAVNMPLYKEVSQWLGVPYRYGGNTRKGVDCSGFTLQVFKKVYGKNLARSTADLAKMKMQNVSKKKLSTGDLVFFATTKSKKKITHVGIYLKDGYFIHASTSKGVIVSGLEEGYYKKAWRKGGRIK